MGRWSHSAVRRRTGAAQVGHRRARLSRLARVPKDGPARVGGVRRNGPRTVLSCRGAIISRPHRPTFKAGHGRSGRRAAPAELLFALDPGSAWMARICRGSLVAQSATHELHVGRHVSLRATEQIVDTGDRAAGMYEVVRQVAAEEAGDAGHEAPICRRVPPLRLPANRVCRGPNAPRVRRSHSGASDR